MTGASGLLGTQLVDAFRAKRYEVVAFDHASLDIEDSVAVEQVVQANPRVVINAAAWTDVDGCARNPERALRINGDAAGRVAAAAARVDAMIVQISTNEVFDGADDRAYAEDDEPNPINPYGASKLAGERAVADATDRHVIVRTAWLFGPNHGFPSRIRAAAERAASAGVPLQVVEDEWGNPTPVAGLAGLIELVVDRALAGGVQAVIHLAGEPPTTRYDWAVATLGAMAVPVEAIRRRDYDRPSVVPRHAVLSIERARRMGLPPLRWQGG